MHTEVKRKNIVNRNLENMTQTVTSTEVATVWMTNEKKKSIGSSEEYTIRIDVYVHARKFSILCKTNKIYRDIQFLYRVENNVPSHNIC